MIIILTLSETLLTDRVRARPPSQAWSGSRPDFVDAGKLSGLFVVCGFFDGLGAGTALEDGRQPSQGRGLPLADLVGMDAVFRGDLG